MDQDHHYVHAERLAVRRRGGRSDLEPESLAQIASGGDEANVRDDLGRFVGYVLEEHAIGRELLE